MPSDSKDVLIHASEDDVGHKFADQLDEDEQAYWRVSGTPRQTEPGRRVWFEQDGRIFAWGEISALEDGRLWFDGAHSVDLSCPVDVPTRGFTYIDPSEAPSVQKGGQDEAGAEHTECEVCGDEPDPDRFPPHYVLSLAEGDITDETVEFYPFGGSVSVPFACSEECWLNARREGFDQYRSTESADCGGAVVKAAEASYRVHCPNCDAAISASSEYCKHCGVRVGPLIDAAHQTNE